MDAEPEHVFPGKGKPCKTLPKHLKTMKFGIFLAFLVGSSGYWRSSRCISDSLPPSCCTRGSSPPTSSSEANNGFPQVPRYHGNNLSRIPSTKHFFFFAGSSGCSWLHIATQDRLQCKSNPGYLEIHHGPKIMCLIQHSWLQLNVFPILLNKKFAPQKTELLKSFTFFNMRPSPSTTALHAKIQFCLGQGFKNMLKIAGIINVGTNPWKTHNLQSFQARWK